MKKSYSQGAIDNVVFNDYSNTKRNTDAGFPVDTIGTISSAAAVKVGKRTGVRITNATGATIFVKSGASGVTAPTNYSDGVAILNNTSFYFNTGDGDHIIFNTTNASAQYVVELSHAKSESRKVGS